MSRVVLFCALFGPKKAHWEANTRANFARQTLPGVSLELGDGTPGKHAAMRNWIAEARPEDTIILLLDQDDWYGPEYARQHSEVVDPNTICASPPLYVRDEKDQIWSRSLNFGDQKLWRESDPWFAWGGSLGFHSRIYDPDDHAPNLGGSSFPGDSNNWLWRRTLKGHLLKYVDLQGVWCRHGLHETVSALPSAALLSYGEWKKETPAWYRSKDG